MRPCHNAWHFFLNLYLFFFPAKNEIKLFVFKKLSVAFFLELYSIYSISSFSSSKERYLYFTEKINSLMTFSGSRRARWVCWKNLKTTFNSPLGAHSEMPGLPGGQTGPAPPGSLCLREQRPLFLVWRHLPWVDNCALRWEESLPSSSAGTQPSWGQESSAWSTWNFHHQELGIIEYLKETLKVKMLWMFEETSNKNHKVKTKIV